MMSWVVWVGEGGAGDGESVMIAMIMMLDEAADDAVDIWWKFLGGRSSDE